MLRVFLWIQQTRYVPKAVHLTAILVIPQYTQVNTPLIYAINANRKIIQLIPPPSLPAIYSMFTFILQTHVKV